MPDVVRSLMGIALLIFIGWLFSMGRGRVQWRVVLSALALQVAIGAVVLFSSTGNAVLLGIAGAVTHALEFGAKGTEFMFGGLVSPDVFKPGGLGFIFAFRVLPTIIYVTALIAVLYYLGIMRWIITILGTVLQKLLGVSKIESFCAVTTIFLGQNEMGAAVKPFVAQLKGPTIFVIMTSGMASVAGAALAGYAGLGVKMEYLIAASFMAIPGGLLFGKLLCPSSEQENINFDNIQFEEKKPENVIEAAASGAALGFQIACAVGAMLIAFIGLIALLNGMIGGAANWMGYPGVNLETLLGKAFAPLAYMLGVSWENAAFAGNLIGQKLILNEFVAYVGLAPYLQDPVKVAAAGLTVIDPRTLAILSFALCGFANISSIAILAGAFGSIAPHLRATVAQYGLRVVVAATLSNLMSATIAGIFLTAKY
ncbi:MAG: NupC/NupG family nucleoside CNT transporter [Rhodocyclaceae bacterium]|nr:NupC/NupG family nucleoside CNT transporter [Rhodocyclaceae bacterium]MCA3025396.1 NupC/NupG family nucleoside CNT transporter [Rhodocyclaceae bacterium]MCA3031614.1 NupC/NupG family nucleoside CNT transporter [Rhodocyclaceae bacterium]MCA3038261.1 NupC/NupG family nucleoside CNT transporter [Rhodocyclaceae bacterium]MCA3039900.1 NupC/NupG family nucleoside CNT transporter [Rhodocyclaceae bacterium]